MQITYVAFVFDVSYLVTYSVASNITACYAVGILEVLRVMRFAPGQ